jgi:predicted unusual protein kinase regulating ubiquinone biosynthesis (AarF/ABC1/UbiB family)
MATSSSEKPEKPEPSAPKTEPSAPKTEPSAQKAERKKTGTLIGVAPPAVGSVRPKKKRALVTTEPEPIYRPAATNTWRFFRAYFTTFQVIASYLWLFFWARVFGDNFKRDRLHEVHKRNAKRVFETILELQGLFIKVGQLLSIMANFLPEVFRHELEGLQDQVPPRPYSEIDERIRSELKKAPDDIFEDFDRTPIASASLGQVHAATTKEGLKVAVKVQHKDIDEMVRLDLITIRRIMMIVQWFVPVQGLDAYYHQIKGLLSEELDFVREADNIERIAKNFSDNPQLIFPVPVRELSTRRVLTSSFVEGKKIVDISAIDAMGVDKKDVAKRLVRAYCQMIFVDGIYHADPHPGNVLVRSDGAIILLDFGAVAELSPSMREGIPEFLEGVLRRNTDSIIKALRKMGFLSRTSDEQVSEKIIEYFHRRFQEEVKLDSFNLKDVKIDPQKGFENLLDLRKMNIGLKELSGTFHIPKDWVLLERTILLLYGCCSILDPELEPMAIIKPYLQDFVLGNRDWREIAMETVRDMALSAVTLPEDLRKYLVRATRGELEVRVKGVSEGSHALYSAGRQLAYVAIVIACGAFALSLHYHGEDDLARWPLGIGGFFVLAYLLSSALGRPRRSR